jgi:hypothetical protein
LIALETELILCSFYIRITIHSVCIGITMCFISVPNVSFDIFFAAARQAPPPAPVQDGGGSMLGGIGSTIAQGRYSKLVVFRIVSDINIIVILELI